MMLHMYFLRALKRAVICPCHHQPRVYMMPSRTESVNGSLYPELGRYPPGTAVIVDMKEMIILAFGRELLKMRHDKGVR